MDKQKLQEVFSDKAYMESIVKMSAEDAAKSLCEKGVEVTAEDLVRLRDFLVDHKEQLQNGQLTEEALADVAGGMSDATMIEITVPLSLALVYIGLFSIALW